MLYKYKLYIKKELVRLFTRLSMCWSRAVEEGRRISKVQWVVGGSGGVQLGS